MNKFQFIKELLDTKKFNPQQKERFFKLVSKELGKVEDQDKKVLGDIQLIKKKIGLVDDETPVNYTVNFNDLDSDGQDKLWNEMVGATNTNTLISKKVKPNPDIPEEEMSAEFKALMAAAYRPSNTADKSDKNKADVNKPLMDSSSTEIPARDNSNPLSGEFNDQVETDIENGLAGLKMGETTSAPRVKSKKNPPKNNDLPRYIDPKGLSEFLLAYNQDPILKYTCHQIDDIEIINRFLEYNKVSEYDIKIHQKKISIAFVALLKKHNINPKIYSLIHNYLNGSATWSSDKVKINWNSDELYEWCLSNKNMIPHPGLNLSNLYKSRGFEFTPFKSKITGKRIKSFSQLIIQFKNLFHIRADNSLKDLIEYRNEEKWNDNVNFEIDPTTFRTNLEMFTDVDKLLQAYDNIINMIVTTAIEYSLPKPIVKITFREEGSIIKLSIHHKNTVFKKTANNLINRVGEIHTALIKNQINGLCELYLNADFDNNEYGHINLWNNQPPSLTPLPKYEGVEHILLFKQ